MKTEDQQQKYTEIERAAIKWLDETDTMQFSQMELLTMFTGHWSEREHANQSIEGEGIENFKKVCRWLQKEQVDLNLNEAELNQEWSLFKAENNNLESLTKQPIVDFKNWKHIPTEQPKEEASVEGLRKELESFYKRMVNREELHDSDEYFIDEICKIFFQQYNTNKVSEDLLNDLLNEQKEIISSPIKFTGVSIEKIKQVFENHGLKYNNPF